MDYFYFCRYRTKVNVEFAANLPLFRQDCRKSAAQNQKENGNIKE